MSRRIGFLLGLCATALGFAAEPAKPLSWRELITVAQARPTTDMKWGSEKAQILERHPQFREVLSSFPRGPKSLAGDVTDGACSFVVHARFDHSPATLSALTLELPPTAAPECGKKWLTALQGLYGKPLRSGPVQDLVTDADTPLQTAWRTPTSCITLTYTASGATHPGPFTVVFGDQQSGACGYDDQAAVVNGQNAK